MARKNNTPDAIASAIAQGPKGTEAATTSAATADTNIAAPEVVINAGDQHVASNPGPATVVEPTTTQKPADKTISTTALNVTQPVQTDQQDQHAGLPRIKISYPKDYKGVRFFEEGEIYPVSKEVAAQLVELGIAKVVNLKS